MREIRKIKAGRRIIALSSVLICTLLLVSIYWINAHAELMPIESIEIESEKVKLNTYLPGGVEYYNGAWKVTESAKWIDYGKAKVSLSIKTNRKYKSDDRDLILAIDVSQPTTQEKVDELKYATKKFINDHLEKNGQRIALIFFATESQIKTDFTNDKDLLFSYIDQLEARDNHNSSNAFRDFGFAYDSIDQLLTNYNNENNRSVVAIVLTNDNYTGDQSIPKSKYKYLKSLYPYLTINSLYLSTGYWKGKSFSLDYLDDVTDDVYLAYPTIIENKLYIAAGSVLGYDELNISDLINTDFFEIVDQDSIEKNLGDVTITNDNNSQKLVWSFKKGEYKSGETEKLSFEVKLKDEFLDKGGIYPVSKKSNIKSKIYGNEDEDVTSNKTPILADNYKVIYDGNAPSSCSVSNVPEQKYITIYKTVKLSDTVPVCDGYQFKGWSIVSEGVEKLNDDTFIMPDKDVTIRAEWKKLSINKSMDGQINKAQTLYDIMKDNSVPDNIESTYVKLENNNEIQIDYSTMSSEVNGKGIYEYTKTSNDTYPVYFYRGDVDNNNVIFSHFCWKAVVTTKGGGVKLLYSGVANSDGTCPQNSDNLMSNIPFTGHSNNYTSNQLGYGGYMNGTKYSALTRDNLLLGRNVSSNYAYTNNGQETLIYSFFNEAYKISSSNASKIKDKNTSGFVTEHLYGTSVSYSNGKYTVLNTEWLNFSTPEKIKGKFACATHTVTECEEVYYILNESDTNPYAIKLSGGKMLDDYYDNQIYLADSIRKNSSGGYDLVNPTTIYARDWYINYDNYVGKYTCGINKSSCDDPVRITQTANLTYRYVLNSEDILFGTGVEYNDGSYEVKNAIHFSDAIIDNLSSSSTWYDSQLLLSHRYTCFVNDNKCSTVFYLSSGDMYGGNLNNSRYIILSDGSNMTQAIKNMQKNDTDSTVKYSLEQFYSTFTPLADYIEDTVYCNDRRVSSFSSINESGPKLAASSYGSEGGYYSGGARAYYENYNNLSKLIGSNIYGDRFTNVHVDLTCAENDSFTVSSTIGNGKLKYPIGILTMDEAMLAGATFSNGVNSNHYYNYGSNSNNYLNNNKKWWLMTLHTYSVTDRVAIMNSKSIDEAEDYTMDYSSSGNGVGVRPVISIKHDVPINGGDGTINDPYVFKLD